MPCTLDDSSHSGGKPGQVHWGSSRGPVQRNNGNNFLLILFLDGGVGDGSQQKKMPSQMTS